MIADRWGGTTYRDNIVYVHILEWEKDQITFEIPGNTMEKWEVISGGKAELTGRKRNLFDLRPDSGARQHDTI